MDFRFLQMRLVSHVRARVRNGEISERGLARITGVSQPHMHNVLKGTRLLSMDMADQILQRLRIDLTELLTAADSAARPVPSAQEAAGWFSSGCRKVALLDGWIGPEHPFPQAEGREGYPFLAEDVDRLVSPVAARMAPDPLRPEIFSGRGVVLLDRAEAARLGPDDEGYFALDLSGTGMIGSVRRVRGHLYLRVRRADGWQSIALPDRGTPDVIQGRVSLVVRQL
ncbi:MAG: helix-turn-helix transcriptional regulator [Bryobacteraceae bacterium]